MLPNDREDLTKPTEEEFTVNGIFMKMHYDWAMRAWGKLKSKEVSEPNKWRLEDIKDLSKAFCLIEAWGTIEQVDEQYFFEGIKDNNYLQMCGSFPEELIKEAFDDYAFQVGMDGYYEISALLSYDAGGKDCRSYLMIEESDVRFRCTIEEMEKFEQEQEQQEIEWFSETIIEEEKEIWGLAEKRFPLFDRNDIGKVAIGTDTIHNLNAQNKRYGFSEGFKAALQSSAKISEESKNRL